MFCKYCGAELESDALFCASCGKRISADSASPAASEAEGRHERKQTEQSSSCEAQEQGNKGTNPFCIAGFVLAILSFFFNYYGIVSIAALVVSAIGLSGAKKEKQEGRTLAIVGIVLSAVLSLIFFIRFLEYSRYEYAFYGAIDGFFHWLDDIL